MWGPERHFVSSWVCWSLSKGKKNKHKDTRRSNMSEKLNIPSVCVSHADMTFWHENMLKHIVHSLQTEAKTSRRDSYWRGLKKMETSQVKLLETPEEENREVKTPSALSRCWHLKKERKKKNRPQSTNWQLLMDLTFLQKVSQVLTFPLKRGLSCRRRGEVPLLSSSRCF